MLGKALSPQWGVQWGAHPDAWVPPGPHGQQHWPEGHPACGGRAQSPIDIRTQWAQPDPSLPPIRPVGQPGTPAFTLSNNGHTGEWVLGGSGVVVGVVPRVTAPAKTPPMSPTPAVLALPPSLRLQGLPRSFAAAQLHFHWGRPGHAGGAEHLLDGHRAPAEVQGGHEGSGRGSQRSGGVLKGALAWKRGQVWEMAWEWGGKWVWGWGGKWGQEGGWEQELSAGNGK